MAKLEGTVPARMAALLADTLMAWRDCRWQQCRNGKIVLCLRDGCGLQTCAEPRRRHLPTCRYGEGIAGPGPVGWPCSPKCQAVQDVLAAYARQPSLLEAV